MADVSWQSRAEAKFEAINQSIPAEWRLNNLPSINAARDVTGPVARQGLSQEEIDITESDAVNIVTATSCGRWTATAVAKAFCHRASIAHQLTNCLHETFFDAAIRDAVILDKYFKDHKKPKGPLHGLPVSLKDQFHVKDVETTMGYVGWIGTFEGQFGTGKEKVFESEMVKELRDLGAILYCKTSVPHTLMAGETTNNIIGTTTNPKNRLLSCGGSSGGEGALIALRGSPCGFGTDIGGSIRVPAAFNGLFGLRPSSGRLPYEGMANSMDGQNTVLSVVGPISHSIAALSMIVKAILSRKPWLHDPLCIEMPWRPDHAQSVYDKIEGGGHLAFGVLRHDDSVAPNPPVRRAINTVALILKRMGHQVLDWKPPSHEIGTQICLKSWNYDGGEDVHAAFKLSGEPAIPPIQKSYGSKSKAQVNASDVAANNIAKREYQKAYMEYWNSTSQLTVSEEPVDAVIMPVAPFAAAQPNKFRYYGYTNIINTLDYTSCTIPVTFADKAVDTKDKNFRSMNENDRLISEDYDPALYDGVPVGIQLVGRRLQEEKILALAEFVSALLRLQ